MNSLPPPGLLAFNQGFLSACETHHAIAKEKLEYKTKLQIAAPIRKRLRNKRVYPNNSSLEEAGFNRQLVGRVQSGDLSGVHTDQLFKLASELGVSVQIAPSLLKRQLLLEELIPDLAKRRSWEWEPWLLKAPSQIDKILDHHVLLEDVQLQNPSAFDSWCSDASELVEDRKNGARVAALAADYLDLRIRLNGFTTKLLALSANDDSCLGLPDEVATIQKYEEPARFSDVISLIATLRRAAISVSTHNLQGRTPRERTNDFLRVMASTFPRSIRKLEPDLIVGLLDHFRLDPADLRDPCQNVGSLVMKSPALRSHVIQLLRGEN